VMCVCLVAGGGCVSARVVPLQRRFRSWESWPQTRADTLPFLRLALRLAAGPLPSSQDPEPKKGGSGKAAAPSDPNDKEMPQLAPFRRLWWVAATSAFLTSGYTLVKMLLLFNDTDSGWSWGLIMLAFCAPPVQVGPLLCTAGSVCVAV
jgi:hypothetical protein